MLINELGTFVANTRYETLPPAVADTVKLRVLDLLAAGLAGHYMGCHRQILPALGGAPEATVWGAGTRIALRDAILVNSFMSHALYLDDGSRFTGGHPSPVVIPPALGLGETQHSSGRALIAAVAAGYEVFLRLGRAIYPSTVVRGFQSTAVLGAVSSAAACANLHGFTPQTATHALAIGCNLGVGLKEALKSSGSQPIQVGRSAEAGVLVARFVQHGAAGADSILENGFLRAFAENADAAGICAGLGTEYRIFETYIKAHGGCRGNHAPVDVVQDTVAKHGIKAADIAKMVVRVDTVTDAAEIHNPRNGEQGQFSVAFSVAVALLFGDASIFQFTDAKVNDPRVREMMGRISVEVDKALDAGYPEKRASSTLIETTDGRRVEGYIDNAKGEPEQPFSPAEIEKKFLTLARETMPGYGEQVHELVMRLETVTDVSALTALLTHGVSKPS